MLSIEESSTGSTEIEDLSNHPVRNNEIVNSLGDNRSLTKPPTSENPINFSHKHKEDLPIRGVHQILC